MKARKHIAELLIILALSAALLMAGCGKETGKAEEKAPESSFDKAGEYLENYFGIEPGREASLQNVNEMLTALGGEPIEAEWKGETVAFEKSYSVNYGVSNDKEVLQKIQTLPGYVQSYSMMWGDHMRWPWLYFNGQGWLESDGE